MIVIYHSRDLDGWCSAAIVKKWFYSNYRQHHEILTLVEWDYGFEVPIIPNKETVVVVDICLPVKAMKNLNDNNELIWLDHHKSAIKELADSGIDPLGLRATNFSACELTWKYFMEPTTPMPEFVRRLGRYDCFGHKGTSEEMDILKFQYAARAFYKNPDDCFEALEVKPTSPMHTNVEWLLSVGNYIYKYLCTEAEQEYGKRREIYFGGHKFALVNKTRLNPINFGISYHEDGYDGFACFWYEQGRWYFSLYNDNGKVDCSEICKLFGGGGHAGAAGFQTDDLESVLSRYYE